MRRVALVDYGMLELQDNREGISTVQLLKNYEELLRHIKQRLPETKAYMMAYYLGNEAILYAGRETGTRTNAAMTRCFSW